MNDFRQSIDIAASRDCVFDFVSDLRNMPRYLPTMESAEMLEGDRIRITGMVRGRRYDAEGQIHLDPDERIMRWSADTDRDYHGELAVTGDQERATLSLCLTFAVKTVGGHLPDEQIRQALMQSLETIKTLCEQLPARLRGEAYLG